jgi:dienelactone hydrolase
VLGATGFSATTERGILDSMSLLSSWAVASHTAGAYEFPTYRKGSGPGVVIIHEIPGITPDVIAFAEEVVAAGYTVVMPSLFGTPEDPKNTATILKTTAQVCIRSEFNKLALRKTSPVTSWLRSLAAELHAELGGPGVGALGMCMTGNFALAMMVDDTIAAPVLAQPSLPFPLGKARKADLNLSPADLAAVKARDIDVLGLCYKSDPLVGTRFATLKTELGERFLSVPLDGKGHSTVTSERQQIAVDRVLQFFADKLRPPVP